MSKFQNVVTQKNYLLVKFQLSESLIIRQGGILYKIYFKRKFIFCKINSYRESTIFDLLNYIIMKINLNFNHPNQNFE